jgi:ATP-binding cassette, subfamily B, bacterial CvaB/MchF/RaxB
MRHATALGFACRSLRVGLDEMSQLRLSSMLNWSLNHFVELAKVRGKRLTILDSAVGKRMMTIAEASDHFTGVALELVPT